MEFRAAVVNIGHTVPLLYVAEYHCNGTVKSKFYKTDANTWFSKKNC